MVQSKEWKSFFNNIEYKTDLIKLAFDYYKTYEFRKNLDLNTHFLITSRESTWGFTKDEMNQIFDCNQEEADTQIVLHACLHTSTH